MFSFIKKCCVRSNVYLNVCVCLCLCMRVCVFCQFECVCMCICCLYVRLCMCVCVCVCVLCVYVCVCVCVRVIERDREFILRFHAKSFCLKGLEIHFLGNLKFIDILIRFQFVAFNLVSSLSVFILSSLKSLALRFGNKYYEH